MSRGLGRIFNLGDIDMPLPDAPDYSKRIYELLKETDLENLSYAQFQGVAEKLFIEPENEDEMRRLVLVQLARMAVRGDWDGFLTGGGASGAPTDAEYVVMSLNGTLTNERKLTAGARITITDGGAGGNVTIAADASPVTSLVAGSNITLSPATGLGDVTIFGSDSPVTSLIAGTNITLSPADGLGDVTITAAGSAGVTFPLEADAGSLGAPSYSFDGDTNTGIYSSAADNVNIVTGGGIRATVNSYGLSLGDNTNVGKVTSLGTNNLQLETNKGVNSGTITIIDGVNNDIELIPNGTGKVKLGTLPFKADQTVGASEDNFVLTYDNTAGSISLETAGGGGGTSGAVDAIKPEVGNGGATTDISWASTEYPFGNTRTTSQTINTNQPLYVPFIARRNDTLDEGHIYISSGASTATDVKIGVYSTVNGAPNTLLGVGSVDVTTTGVKTTTLVAQSGQSLTTVAGTQYWIGAVRSASNDFTVGASDISYSGAMAWRTQYNGAYGILSQSGSDNALPATASFSTGFAYQFIAVGVSY